MKLAEALQERADLARRIDALKSRLSHNAIVQEGELPALLNDIEIHHDGKTMIAEVAQHIGDNVARCIAMSSTDGLVRGADAVDT